MIALVISSLQDGYTGPVLRELPGGAGFRRVLLDHRRFPAELVIKAEFGNGGTEKRTETAWSM